MRANGASRARVLDGALVSEQIKQEVKRDVANLLREHRFQPSLAVVRVGDDAASAVYIRNKVRTSEDVGIRSEQHALSATSTTEDLLSLIYKLNRRDDIDGILVQLPLPGKTDERMVLEAVDPSKDVDGFHPLNVGRLALGQTAFVPCTPAGIMELLQRSAIQLDGSNACVLGRSNIVGRPMAQLLLQCNATVTICHSRTRDLPSVTKRADILIVAIGRPGLVRAVHIKPGATVIDVGMNRITDPDTVREFFGEAGAKDRLETLAKRGYTLVGDVHPEEADQVAGLRTPVPGGVGLLTVAMLMRNTVKAACLRNAFSLQ